jgi:hypothetical protein
MNHDLIVTILSALLVISEALGGIKVVGENSIYQVLLKILKAIAALFTNKKETATA